MYRLAKAVCSVAAIAAVVALGACGRKESATKAPAAPDTPLIRIDGSSTVFPIAEAVAEEFQKRDSKQAQVTVGVSGTGGGFKKMCRGEIDIANASRPILTAEMEACRAAGVRYLELPIAFDAITIVVNPNNNWVQSLTLADLRKMWEPAAQATVTRWNQVRPDWPDAPLMLFGPGADSGTFDYFTEAVNHKAKASRGDFTASEDDNVLVQGVENNKNSLGYFGFAYYTSHKERMRAVPIVTEGGKAIGPSTESVIDGTYQPLSRPLFIYVNEASAKRPEMRAFIEYYLTEGGALASEVGFVPLPAEATRIALAHFRENRVGTVFGGVPEVGVTIASLLAREAKL